jgi:undecaprenyl-diphosphatase
MARPRRKPRISPLPLLATAAASAAGFGTTATLVKHHKTSWSDGHLRRHFPKRRKRTTEAIARTLGYTGKPYVHGIAAALVEHYFSHHDARDAGRAVSLASTLAATASKTFDWVLHKRLAPPGRHSVTEPSFPSGHTLETAAVALTIAYVAWREGKVDAYLAFPAALAVPLASGVGRLYLDRHWVTDVIGGLFAGVSIAALCAAGYELRTQSYGRSRG